MTWFRVDDTFALHPKVLTAGNAAIGLWVRAATYVASQLTDGYIPADMVKMLGGRPADVAKLIDAGLWERAHGGYRFHDWEDYQLTRKAVEQRRVEDRERKAKSRRRGLDVINGGRHESQQNPQGQKA